MRLWSCGFELNSTANQVEWTDSFVSAAGTIVTSPSFSGTYAYKVTAGSTSARDRVHVDLFSADGNGPYFLRMRLRVDDLPDGPTTIIHLRQSGNNINGPRIRLEANGTLTLRDDNGQIGSASPTLVLGQDYIVEMRFFNNTSSGFMEATARLNLVTFASTTTSTDTGGTQKFFFGPNDLTTNYTLYIDDLAVNDSTGSGETSYPGEGFLVYARPTSDGDFNDASAGSWADMDETPPDDTTTRVNLDADNDIIDVNVTNSASLGIPPNATIKMVQVGIRAAAASNAACSFKLRIKSAAGGTVTESATTTLNSSTYSTNGADANIRAYVLTSYLDPTTGLPWTATGTNSLGNMQIGVQAIDATPDVRVSALWAIIEYVPAGNAAKANILVVDNPTQNQTKANILVADNPASQQVKANVMGIKENASQANILVATEKESVVTANILALGQAQNQVKANILQGCSQDSQVKAQLQAVREQVNMVKASIAVVRTQENSVKASIYSLADVVVHRNAAPPFSRKRNVYTEFI